MRACMVETEPDGWLDQIAPRHHHGARPTLPVGWGMVRTLSSFIVDSLAVCIRLAGMQTTFGQRLRAVREARGVSVRELAQELGVVTQRIYDLEKDNANPTLRTVRSLAQALGVEQGELVG
jgi:DNA-binding XRE family transcriptional regulator